MSERQQDEVVRFLQQGAGLGVPAAVIETHISMVFLLPKRVLKLKRAVKLPYVDFSTPALRLAACRREVELNRRTAPSIYRGVCCITRDKSGRLALNGEGDAVEAVVDMNRFDQDCLFERLAAQHRLDEATMTKLARAIARFHGEAEVIGNSDGLAAIRTAMAANEAGFSASNLFEPQALTALLETFRDRLRQLAPVLARRAGEGRIRRCHGDLHLRNICLLDGEPTLFDCIEFNDDLATIDVLYDLAFLLMDLWYRGEQRLANLVLNRYLDAVDDEDGFTLLPFYMAVRAAVRAHVLAMQAGTGHDNHARRRAAAEAHAYFSLAQDLLRQPPAQLVALSGFSGSGKTTVAEALAGHLGAPPGARIIESDRIRKAMFGVTAETRLPERAYRPEVSQQVYAEMMRRVGVILHAGGAVVANAVFDRSADRARIEELAQKAGVAFAGYQLVLAPEALRQRIEARPQGPSDATVEVLDLQLGKAPVHEWWHPLDASRPPGEVADHILGNIGMSSRFN